MDNGDMSDIPRRALTRSVRLASLPLGHAGRVAVGLGKRVGGAPAEAVAAEVQARTAAQLFSVLGQLKGGAMKFGQALSVMEAARPEERSAPYRATLTKLQDAAPAMPAATVHAILAVELGPRWRTAKFLEFDNFSLENHIFIDFAPFQLEWFEHGYFNTVFANVADVNIHFLTFFQGVFNTQDRLFAFHRNL